MLKKILVVDDEPDLLDTIEEALVVAGYEVIRAKDGRQAWEVLSNSSPSVILSDYRMPRMNGCELFELVRNSLKNRNMPFIFMSSNPERITSIGNYVVLRKPFQFDTLLSHIKTMTD